MSLNAQDLIELIRLAQSGVDTRTVRMLRQLARNLISPGVADLRGGC